jgi:hypothetical protein
MGSLAAILRILLFIPVLLPGEGAACRDKITPAPTQFLTAEIPARGGTVGIDIACCPPCSILELFQVTAGIIGEKIPPGFTQTPLPQVVELGGIALPDHQQRDPPAALPTTAAVAGDRDGLGGFHMRVSVIAGKLCGREGLICCFPGREIMHFVSSRVRR